MIQVWQAGIVNTQGFEKYFLLMGLRLREFSTGAELTGFSRTQEWG